MGSPMRNVKVTITGGKYSPHRSRAMVFENCAALLLKELIEKADPILLEPVMNAEIITPSEHLKDIVTDVVNKRRGHITELQDLGVKFGGSSESPRSLVKCSVPLAETLGYSTYLRSVTKGEATFTMAFKEYEPVSQSKMEEILANPHEF